MPKTRLDDVNKKYPNIKRRSDGIFPAVCCIVLGYCSVCKESNCQKCWNTPLQEE